MAAMAPLTIAVGSYGLTKALKDGTVASDRLALEFVEISPITRAMRRMVREAAFDICEMAFTTYLCAKALGKPVTAIVDQAHRRLAAAVGAGQRR